MFTLTREPCDCVRVRTHGPEWRLCEISLIGILNLRKRIEGRGKKYLCAYSVCPSQKKKKITCLQIATTIRACRRLVLSGTRYRFIGVEKYGGCSLNMILSNNYVENGTRVEASLLNSLQRIRCHSADCRGSWSHRVVASHERSILVKTIAGGTPPCEFFKYSSRKCSTAVTSRLLRP